LYVLLFLCIAQWTL